jgi:hypothetical protein
MTHHARFMARFCPKQVEGSIHGAQELSDHSSHRVLGQPSAAGEPMSGSFDIHEPGRRRDG